MQVYNTRSFRLLLGHIPSWWPEWQASQPFGHGDLNHGHLYHNGVPDCFGVFFVTPRIASSKAYRQWTVILVTNEQTNGQGNSREDMQYNHVIFLSRGRERDLKILTLNYKSLELGS